MINEKSSVQRVCENRIC